MSQYNGTLPPGSELADFNRWIQTGEFRETGLVLSGTPDLGTSPADYRAKPVHECSSESGQFEYKGLRYARMYGGPDEHDHHYYYNGNSFANAFELPASAMVTE